MEENINRVILCGDVAGEPYLSHVNHGESFYKFPLSVPRLSGQTDELSVVAPGILLERSGVSEGDRIRVSGQLRSFNNKSGQGRRLVISVFIRQLEPGGEIPENCIRLSGVICKPPVLRRTPLGRDICDLILAVNRRYGRSDYLPCIAWGAVAQQTAAMPVGRRLTVEGRVQSRIYTKMTPAGAEDRVAYEVSIMRPAEPEEFLADQLT